MKNRTMQEMNERYKSCKSVKHEYQVGDRDINDVMYQYAENKAMSEMLGLVPKAVTA